MASIPATFRAYQYEQHGAPEQVLKLRSGVKQAQLAPTQVRVKVHSAALNSVDVGLANNMFSKLLSSHPTPEHPFGMGLDGAGTVVEVGSDLEKDEDLKVGSAVYFMAPFNAFGSFAEYFVVDRQFVVPKPTALSFDQAASVPLTGLTSYQALKEHAKLQSGERVLILGGSASTGIFAIQIAKALGAHVITTASARNIELVKSLGADEVIDYTTTKWVDVLPPHSIDVLYDCGVEHNVWNTNGQTVLRKETGRFVTLHPLVDPVASAHGAKLVGFIVVHPSGPQLSELAKLIDDGKIVSPIDSLHSFENVLDAVARISSCRATGKIVIQVAPYANRGSDWRQSDFDRDFNGSAQAATSDLTAEIKEVARLARDFNSVHWTHARSNTVADLLANWRGAQPMASPDNENSCDNIKRLTRVRNPTSSPFTTD